jgi:hypothetical protein
MAVSSTSNGGPGSSRSATTTTEEVTMSDDIKQAVKRQSQGHLWGSQLRREIDVLFRACEGIGATSVFEALATEAVIADDGTLNDTTGKAGYAWNPQAQIKKGVRNPAGERVKSAGASLGRVLSGGHPDHRTYLAYLQAMYVVTTQQDYDVTARIEMLWDQMAYDVEPETEEELVTATRRSWLGRVWDRIVCWWRTGTVV